ncbi:Uma2 family endonuclease [Streptomyces sp. 8N616]|uniref:Uma2 family endonuclease n=1 Tax=Streptomyces sp. 8N616 TaxID=3457414 RepID=UPI003FD51165
MTGGATWWSWRRNVVRLGPDRLRAAADVLRKTTGLRVEVLPAAPPRPGKYVASVRMLRAAIGSRLPAGLIAAEGVSVRMPDDPDDYVTPDLTVCPSRFLDSDESLIHPQDVELAVELVAQPADPQEITARIGQYATAAVRTLLLIDPGEGVWALYTHAHPQRTAYLRALHGDYGDQIPLPDPLAFLLATVCLPRFGGPGGRGSPL